MVIEVDAMVIGARARIPSFIVTLGTMKILRRLPMRYLMEKVRGVYFLNRLRKAGRRYWGNRSVLFPFRGDFEAIYLLLRLWCLKDILWISDLRDGVESSAERSCQESTQPTPLVSLQDYGSFTCGCGHW